MFGAGKPPPTEAPGLEGSEGDGRPPILDPRDLAGGGARRLGTVPGLGVVDGTPYRPGTPFGEVVDGSRNTEGDGAPLELGGACDRRERRDKELRVAELLCEDEEIGWGTATLDAEDDDGDLGCAERGDFGCEDPSRGDFGCEAAARGDLACEVEVRGAFATELRCFTGWLF